MHSSLGTMNCGSSQFCWGERTYIMGICNASSDSFSGDGLANIDALVAQAKQQVADGADIIDIGGESTRPGFTPLSAEEELRRVLPVIERLSAELPVPISIDTYKSEVAQRAIAAGARMINDISGLHEDPDLAVVAAEANVPLILLSNQRYPGEKTGDIIEKITASLKDSIIQAIQSGMLRENLIIDPGIGFGKTGQENMDTLKRLGELKVLECPILLGASRKLLQRVPFSQRQWANAATTAIGIANGSDMVRVHEVKEMAQVCRVSDAIIRRRK